MNVEQETSFTKEQYKKLLDLWQADPIRTVSDLERVLDNFRILFAYHSGKIENDEITWHDTREIFENGTVTGFSGSPRTLFEQQNQKTCYEYLKQPLTSKQGLDIALILEVHRILTSGTYDERRFLENGERPGSFKKHEYVTGIHDVGAEVELVEDEMQSLLEEMNAYSGNQPLLAAAYFHASFESIHPFADGNGRVGRTLMNYWLMTRDHPPLIIHDEDKRLYFECLQHFDETEELQPLHEFILHECVKTWKWKLEMNNKKPRTKQKFQDTSLER